MAILGNVNVGNRFYFKSSYDYDTCQATQRMKGAGYEMSDVFLEVDQVKSNDIYRYTVYSRDGRKSESCSGCIKRKHLKTGPTISEQLIKFKNNTMQVAQNIIEKIKFELKGEPTKSLIKAGILDSQEQLTSDGRRVLEMVLVEAFTKELKAKADVILSEEKKDEAVK